MSVDNSSAKFNIVKLKSKRDIYEKKSIRRNLFPQKCPSLLYKTKSVLCNSVHKINQTFLSLRDKIATATQSLRFNAYTRHEMDQCDFVPSAFQTPSRRVQKILGRTPTKLYSPFGIETPCRFQ